MVICPVNKTILQSFVLGLVVFSAFSETRYEYAYNTYFILEKQDDASTHLWIQKDKRMTSEYVLESYAPDGYVRNFSFINSGEATYLFVEYNYGSFGTRSRGEKVDLYIFCVSNAKLDFITTITIWDILYYPSTDTYVKIEMLGYFYDANKKSIMLFKISTGKMQIIKEIPL